MATEIKEAIRGLFKENTSSIILLAKNKGRITDIMPEKSNDILAI